VSRAFDWDSNPRSLSRWPHGDEIAITADVLREWADFKHPLLEHHGPLVVDDILALLCLSVVQQTLGGTFSASEEPAWIS